MTDLMIQKKMYAGRAKTLTVIKVETVIQLDEVGRAGFEPANSYQLDLHSLSGKCFMPPKLPTR